MSGQEFGFQGSWADAIHYLVPEIDASARRQTISIADGMNQQLEEFVNRYVVRVNNDSGDVDFGGIVSFQDGTAGAPGITFESDPDTGVYLAGSNSISITTAGTRRFGLGTASSYWQPTVVPTASDATLNGGTNYRRLYLNDNGDVRRRSTTGV